jgi:hypothetical protein
MYQNLHESELLLLILYHNAFSESAFGEMHIFIEGPNNPTN